MTRVLVIEASGNLWGSERSLLDLLRGRPNLQVAICCPSETPLMGELEKLRIRTLPYYVYGLHEKSKWQRLRAAMGVLRACLEFRPDVIHLNQSGSYKVILPAATLLNLPIVAHIRIFEDVAYLARQSPSPRRLRGMIAISLAVEAEIRRFKTLEPIPLHRIYDAYTSWPRLPSSAEKTLHRVACVGRLVRIKGQDVLINALGFLNDFEGGVECLMVGEGEEAFVQELKQIASNVNVASSIQWLGFVSDIMPQLRTCSVLACPSHREPLGRVIFEAWDAGAVPVVFAGSGGAAEIVAAAEGGIIYDRQEPETLARALQEALELDHEQRTRFVNNGRSWMAKNCDPESYGDTVSRILTNARGLRRGVIQRPSSSIRALVIEASGNLWGSERSLLDLLKGMPKLEVAVCCPPKTPLNGELEKLRIRTLPYYIYSLHKKSRWQRLRAAMGVLRACLEFRPDVIHLNQSGSYKVTLTAATLLNLPIVAHIRIFEDVAYLASQSPSPHRLRGMIAISLAVEAEIRRFKALQAIPLYRIYNAYASSPRPFSSAGKTLKRVACVGRLVRIKGQDVLINALGFLKNFEGGVECLMVGEGDGEFVQEIKQIASNVNVASSIQWLGFVGEVVPLLQTCSVLICPSHREPLGRVIFEAWDAGALPVVFAGSGGAAEIVAAAHGGILYEEQKPESLAQALRDALELDHEQQTRFVNNGRSWMAKNCDPESYGEAVSTMLSGACVSPPCSG